MPRLDVKVVQARNLPAVAFQSSPQITAPNPYIKLEIGSKQSGTVDSRTTSVSDATNTSAPKWKNEIFKMKINNPITENLMVQVWHRDVLGGDVLIATCEVKNLATRLIRGEVNDEWIPLSTTNFISEDSGNVFAPEVREYFARMGRPVPQQKNDSAGLVRLRLLAQDFGMSKEKISSSANGDEMPDGGEEDEDEMPIYRSMSNDTSMSSSSMIPTTSGMFEATASMCLNNFLQ